MTRERRGVRESREGGVGESREGGVGEGGAEGRRREIERHFQEDVCVQ